MSYSIFLSHRIEDFEVAKRISSVLMNAFISNIQVYFAVGNIVGGLYGK